MNFTYHLKLNHCPFFMYCVLPILYPALVLRLCVLLQVS